MKNINKATKRTLPIFHLEFPFSIWKILKRYFYRAKYFLKYKIKIQESIFLDFRLIGILIIFLSLMYILFAKRPVYFGLPMLATQLYTIENILRTISIFISIVFSFIVLSFNIFHKYFGRFTFFKFFTSRYIKFIFTLFIATIIVLIYTSVYLKEGNFRTDYGDYLFIFCIILSLILVFSIFPVLIMLLRSSQNRNNIQSLISAFNKDWTESKFYNEIFNRDDKDDFNQQRDPIILLMEIGTAAIKDFDRQSLISIKKGCIGHLKKIHADFLLEDKLSPNEYYVKTFELTRNLFQVAIKERNESAASIVVKMQFDIEEFYIEQFKDFNEYRQSEYYYDGISYMIFMEHTFIKCLQFNEDTVAEQIIELCRRWWEVVIKIYLPMIGYDFPKDQILPTDKPSHLISYTYMSLENMFQNALTYKKVHLYKAISKFYNVTDLEIIGSDNTRNTKVYLLQRNGMSSSIIFEKFIKQIDTEITWGIYPFGLAVSQELTNIKSQIPAQYELRAFEMLFSINKLNVFVINNIKAIALHALSNFTSNEAGYKSLLLSIFEKFNTIRGYIIADPNDKKKEIYILLHKYLGWIKEWIPKNGVTDEELIAKIDEVLANFTAKDTFEAELNAKGYIVKDHLS